MKSGLRGASHVITTGCAPRPTPSGTRFARSSTARGDVFLVGGVDATIVRGIMEGFILMRVVSTRRDDAPVEAFASVLRRPRRFRPGRGIVDVRRRGIRAGESTGARAYGEIAGYGATCDAHHRIRLDESGEEPARAMALALGEAGLRSGGHRVSRLPRHVDRDERPHGNPRREDGVSAPRPGRFPVPRSSP